MIQFEEVFNIQYIECLKRALDAAGCKGEEIDRHKESFTYRIEAPDAESVFNLGIQFFSQKNIMEEKGDAYFELTCSAQS